MRPLQITLFIIANVIFITQSGRDIHRLFWGPEHSIMDQFDPEKTKARSEKGLDVLVNEYRNVNKEIDDLENGKGIEAVRNIQQEHRDLFARKNALQSEISERESKNWEFRDLWIFTAFGAALIVSGGILYSRGILWPGVSIVIAGFAIFEYWASPPFFNGASGEFHALLVSKTLLTFVALSLLYVLWRIMGVGGGIAPKEKLCN